MLYREQYQTGLERYRAGDFAAAENIWRCQAEDSDAGSAARSPLVVMARRCAELKVTPPPVWDGVFVKTSK
jgi:hypothetical protein